MSWTFARRFRLHPLDPVFLGLTAYQLHTATSDPKQSQKILLSHFGVKIFDALVCIGVYGYEL